MDLKAFSQELNNILIDNSIMKLKLKAVEEEVEKIRQVTERYGQFSDTNLILTGIIVKLENIIEQ